MESLELFPNPLTLSSIKIPIPSLIPIKMLQKSLRTIRIAPPQVVLLAVTVLIDIADAVVLVTTDHVMTALQIRHLKITFNRYAVTTRAK